MSMAGSGTVTISAPDYEKVLEVFPELALITDEELRLKVALVWLKLWQMSGYKDLRDAIFMPHLPSRTLVAHTRSVTRAAIGTARALVEVHGMTVDMDRLIALGLLHDASKCIEYEHKGGDRYGRSDWGKHFEHSYLAVEVARRVGVPKEIVHGIAAHSPHSPVVNRYLEGVIVACVDGTDADCMSFVEGRLPERLKKGLPRSLWSDVFESD